MMLAFPVALALVKQCAPGIAPEALLSIVSVESGFDPLAINVNHVGRFHPSTAAQAEALASRWIRAGYSVDLGVAQINSANLAWTGLSLASAFDSCANLAAAEKVLQVSYAKASREGEGVDAISRTFSLYNSGSITTGFGNHYVARVWRAAGQVVARLGGSFRAAMPANAALPALPSFVVAPGDASVLVFK